MRYAYVVVGELEDGRVCDYYAVCHSMAAAEDLCYEAELENPSLVYTWYCTVEEDDK